MIAAKTMLVARLNDESNDKKYLQIELDQKEFDQITQRYESLLQ